MIYAGMAAEVTPGDGGLPVKGLSIAEGGVAGAMLLYALDPDGNPVPVTTTMLAGALSSADVIAALGFTPPRRCWRARSGRDQRRRDPRLRPVSLH
jgi:hypothetical protein